MTDLKQDVGGESDPFFAGDSLRMEFTVTESDGSAKDLTGATVTWGMAPAAGNVPTLVNDTDDTGDTAVTVEIENAGTGEVSVTLDSGSTDDLVGAYRHELEVEDSGGNVDTVARGTLTIDQDIVNS